ncbi:sulfite exporter TauE/SafE family protein [Massilia sp. PAMC28688]|nr:sulfite exporter TauE/SafE family protein [Massilia sp. PAMC28688]
MCGGIVSAFSLAPARRFPVAVVTHTAPAASAALARSLAYNAGRIGSYAMAGAIAGGAAGGARMLAGGAALQTAGLWMANLLLLAIGLYLAGALPLLARVEKSGQGLWRRIQPLTRSLLPADTPFKLAALGALWGWLPCGIVYSMLLTAMLAGSAQGGALVMLAFGLGTLPVLATLGAAGGELQRYLQRRAFRMGAGALIGAFGLLGLWRAWHGVAGGWLDVLCLTAAP